MMQRMIGAVMGLCIMLGCPSVFAETVGVVNLEKVNAVMHFKNIIKARVSRATKEQEPVLTGLSSKISAKEIELRKKTASLSTDLRV